jgi:CBS domain containing-hemolysin-like protein
LKFGAVGLLVFANAFFVATEFSLVSARRSRIEALAREGTAGAATLLKAIANVERYIAGTQLGITLASLGLGWIGESTLEHLLLRVFYFVPPALIQVGAPAVTAFLVITFLHVVLGEMVPKSFALQHAETTALRFAPIMRVILVVLSPLVWVLSRSGRFFLRRLGVKEPAGGHGGMVHSVEELKILVEDSHKQGVLDEMERMMLHRVFKMKELVARQVMVHRLDIIGIPVEMPYEGLMLAVVDAPYSRFPVYDGDLDHVVGILFVKDLIGYRRTPQSGPFDLRNILRPALFVPESVPIETLLAQFKKARTQMAIVLDEFGGTSGLVTLEDVVEELLGELNALDGGAEAPVASPSLRRPVVVDGRTRLDVLNEKYGLELEDEEVDTIAGLVTNRLGRVPGRGEEVVVGNVLIRVRETEGPRLTLLSLSLIELPPVAESGAGESTG